MKRALFTAGVGALLLAAVALGAPSASRSPKAAKVVVSTKKLPKLGVVLVDGKGRTLYMFVPDKRRKVTCVGDCAVSWPPLKLPKGAKAVPAGAARQKLLGSLPDPAGGRVVTYNGWPLYNYLLDTKPGADSGQATNLNGGLWYVLSPSGQVIRTKP